MTYRQTPNLNPPVSLLKSTYDPSRQMSSMQQTIKNAPNTKTNQLPPSPNSYPQPSKNIAVPISSSSMNSLNTSNNIQNKNNPHPSESGRVPAGLPVHPNSREGQMIRNTQTMQNAQNSQNSQNTNQICFTQS